MTKPIMNLDEVAFDDIEENGKYTSSRGQISDHIGAKKLGYNLDRGAAGQGAMSVPLPSRRGGDVPHHRRRGRAPLRRSALSVARARCDRVPDGRARRSRIRSSTPARTTMRYLALSTRRGARCLRISRFAEGAGASADIVARAACARCFGRKDTVDYYDRESIDEVLSLDDAGVNGLSTAVARKRDRQSPHHNVPQAGGTFVRMTNRCCRYWQPENLNDARRVLQLNAPFALRYSVVYQNVQSSIGSIVIAL